MNEASLVPSTGNGSVVRACVISLVQLSVVPAAVSLSKVKVNVDLYCALS